MTAQGNVDDAKSQLPDLVERAAHGEDIVIGWAGRPRVRLVPIAARVEPRRPGRWTGAVVLGPDWDKDLTDQFEDL